MSDHKEVSAANLAILASLKPFISDCCQSFELSGEDGGREKAQSVLDSFEHHRDLAMDNRLQMELERVNANRCVEPTLQLEPAKLKKFCGLIPNLTKDEQDSIESKFSLACMFGIKRGTCNTLYSMGFMSMLHVQGEGARVMALAKLQELKAAFGGTIKDAVDAFENLKPTDSEKLQQIPSLVTGSMLPGDALYVPAGYVHTQKIVNSHAFGVRVPSHFMSYRTLPSIDCVTASLRTPKDDHSPMSLVRTH